MTLYAVSHVTTGNPASDPVFGSRTFFEKREQAQRQLDNYKDGYQKFYEVRSFNITPQS